MKEQKGQYTPHNKDGQKKSQESWKKDSAGCPCPTGNGSSQHNKNPNQDDRNKNYRKDNKQNHEDSE